MHILVTYITNMQSVGSFIKEKMGLQEIWTSQWTGGGFLQCKKVCVFLFL